MAINIIGAGPTGMTIAWELSRMGKEVHVWEKHDTCGGSWWEPEGGRNMHAPRVLFRHAFVNFRTILTEMGLVWEDYFTHSDAISKSINASLKYFSLSDYYKLFKLFVNAKTDPTWAKSTTIRDEMKDALSDDGEKLLSVMPIAIDGIGWERMTVWEFVDSLDTTLISTPYTQRVSGRKMGMDMQMCLEDNGVIFHFNEELVDMTYKENSFMALFKSGKTIGTGEFILAVDPGPAKKFIKNNWGDVHHILDEISYGCVHVLMDFKEKPNIQTDIEVLAENEGDILPVWEGDLLSCAIYKPLGIPESHLIEWIVRTLKIPHPDDYVVCWGSKWNGTTWEHEQTSGIYTGTPINTTGKCPNVHMVGMMSPREIPFASIESAVEVGRRFVMVKYNGRCPIYTTTASSISLVILIVFFLIAIYR
jgi:hypothetical protein